MQKELGYDLKFYELWLSVMLFAIILVISFDVAHAEESEFIEVEIKYTNGDRADFNGINLIVYQDFNNTPYVEKTLEKNPDVIFVPKNHRYKIEVYANGMYADAAYVELKDKSEKIDIHIPLPGGLELGVFYKNGKPIQGATVIIKSQDNTEWRKGITNDQGKTLRFWIQSTNRQQDFYIADIYLGEIFLKSFYPIKLQAGMAFDQKIITNIPEVVEELIIVNLYSGSKKITSNDGSYKVTINDLHGNKITSSDVTFRGDAQFSNLKSGTYIVKITSNNELEDTLWPQTKIHVIGDVNKFNIYKNLEIKETLETPFISCNCISFRLDDVQDYWLSETQLKIIDLFAEKNIPLTIGLIGNVTGYDKKITDKIKEKLIEGDIEIANHSWNNDILTSKSFEIQEKYILDTNKRIFEVYGVNPSVFIPPENMYDKNTINILKNNGFTHLTSHIKDNSLTKIDQDLFIVPATTETGKLFERTVWTMNDNNIIKNKIIQSIHERGYAIIMMHPQEFSLNENGVYGAPNQKAITELSLLLDELSELSSKIIKTSDVKPKENDIVKEAVEKQDTCNCVAFRLDGVQDYWLNNVQINIISTFLENKTPLTVGIIADAFGMDKKITDFIKENSAKPNSNLEIATKGLGLTPYTNYDKTEQNENLKKSIELIQTTTNIIPHVFIPPDNKINSNTLEILKENQITHISTSLINEGAPPFNLKGETIYRFPQTASTGKYNSATNLFEIKPTQQIFEEVNQSITNYGFAVVSIQPQEFSSIINSTYVNSPNQNNLDNLVDLLKMLKEKNYDIVTIGKINSNLVVSVPVWIKSNAGWWADGSIDDKTFVQGIEYLVKNGIIMVSEKSQITSDKEVIPVWIKSNAGWWADGSIDDKTFVQGIEYLVKNGIITY
ncbi:MAG: polysaccharide deacetylase family protein [Nitrosopumilus sp.]|uniref:polysaccharide deacetylase family protein n=1 Tax=Nitrosopumilus sp. TaxID=2024843 RepID=UPI00247D3C96|nr:polysaccharide deacetylase family protein [Nitrosopumilus sp.]MCV0392218.1 polysaccharide deacetylase family protein [Nitrosopumilus sp.]